jgi:hypothetical protein
MTVTRGCIGGDSLLNRRQVASVQSHSNAPRAARRSRRLAPVSGTTSSPTESTQATAI